MPHSLDAMTESVGNSTAIPAQHDQRQRFYLQDLPIRGEVVHLQQTLHTILNQKSYPLALQHLLGEMLVASALLASTLKVRGRLSLQLQGNAGLKWAMAECDHDGQLRALAEWEQHFQFTDSSSQAALHALGQGVLFINIEPEYGERYQGIVALDQPTLAQCLMQYYDLSAQIPTRLVLAAQSHAAGGILVQLLPRNEQEQEYFDDDAWRRMQILTDTVKAQELTDLPATEILYRLYHQEQLRLPESETLQFGCTCSSSRCEDALRQIGEQAVRDTLLEQNPIEMNCQFCNAEYRFTAQQALGLFGQHVS